MNRLPLSADERTRVRAFLYQDAPASTLATAREVHYAARYLDYDGAAAQLRSLVDHPACARGTALLVYWFCEPSELFGGCTTREEVAKNYAPAYADIFDLMVDIEQRLAAFPDGEIGYDPANDDGVDLTAGAGDLARPIASQMFVAARGAIIDPAISVLGGA